ncbi:MAG: hypothetical protein RJB04_2368 [Verrucomicrobiota bacterium]|jgi:hypothetical protein
MILLGPRTDWLSGLVVSHRWGSGGRSGGSLIFGWCASPHQNYHRGFSTDIGCTGWPPSQWDALPSASPMTGHWRYPVTCGNGSDSTVGVEEVASGHRAFGHHWCGLLRLEDRGLRGTWTLDHRLVQKVRNPFAGRGEVPIVSSLKLVSTSRTTHQPTRSKTGNEAIVRGSPGPLFPSVHAARMSLGVRQRLSEGRIGFCARHGFGI